VNALDVAVILLLSLAGPNIYTVSEKFAPMRDGSDEAERSALTKANEYCARQGRQLVPSAQDVA
jgi:hypothetical protein